MEGSLSKETLQSIRRIHIKMEHLANDLLAGLYRSAFKGKGMEFEEVRPYQSGDEIRSIDWNVTARMQAPYVKHFREERELSIFLVVDISSSLRFGTKNVLKSALIAEIAAVLAFSGIKNQDKIGLILFSEEVEHYLPPKKGIRHVLRLIRDLMIVKPKKRGTSVAKSLSFLAKVQKKPCVVFLLSDFFCPDFSKEVSLVAKKHDLIAVHVSDPIENAIPNIGLVQIQDLENEVVRLIDTSDHTFISESEKKREAKKIEVKKIIEKVNGSWIEVQTDQSYLLALRKFLLKRKRGMR